jgi:hypothetical protein
MDELHEAALRLPGTAEGVACAGTALEARTVTVRGKAFVFLRQRELRLKLRDSLPEATTLATEQPDVFKVGTHGWVTVDLADEHRPRPIELLTRWIEESHAVIGGR